MTKNIISKEEREEKVKKAIEAITYYDKKFPEEPFRILSQYPEEAIPYLMEAINKAIKDQDDLDEGYELHLYAMFLLAQYGYKEAFPLILKLISTDSEILEGLIGDVITEGLNNIIYSLYNGDLEALENYLFLPNVNSFAKGAVVNVLVQLYLDGEVKQEWLMDLFKRMIYMQPHEDYEVRTLVIGGICDCHFVSMLPDIAYLYEQELVDEFVYGRYEDCFDYMFSYNKAHRTGCCKIENIEEELRYWAMFEQDEKKKAYNYRNLEKALRKAYIPTEQIKKQGKIYPNDPCPCGSGKKYKKCCMNRQVSKEALEERYWEQDRIKWLKNYPEYTDERIEGRVYIEDYYDRDSIEIDKLLYLALMNRPAFMGKQETLEEQAKRQIYYLSQAYERFKARCETEGIKTFVEYDKKYSMHYESKDWTNELVYLLRHNGRKEEGDEILKVCRAMNQQP